MKKITRRLLYGIVAISIIIVVFIARYDFLNKSSATIDYKNVTTISSLENKGQIISTQIGLKDPENVEILKIDIPSGEKLNPALMYESINQKIAVYYDDELIYSYGMFEPIIGKSPGWRLNIIEIPQEAIGRSITLEVTNIYDLGIMKFPRIIYGEKELVMANLIFSELVVLVMAVVILAMGTIALIVEIILCFKNKSSYIYGNTIFFYMFSTFFALMLIAENNIVNVFLGHTYFLYFGSYMSLILCSIILAFSVIESLNSKDEKFDNTMKIFFLLVIFITLTLVISQKCDFREVLPFLQLATVLIIGVVVVYSAIRKTLTRKIIPLLPIVFATFLEIISYYIYGEKYLGRYLLLSMLVFMTIQMINGVRSLSQYAKDQNEKEIVDYYLRTDILTKCKNRYSYEEKIDNIKNELIYLSVVDVNDLKKVNDNLGHHKGDVLLIEVVQLIKSVFDEKNIFRIGGDEFVIFHDREEYDNIEEKINDLRRLCQTESRNLGFEISFAIGYDKMIVGKDSFSNLFYSADKNMYKNKTDMKS